MKPTMTAYRTAAENELRTIAENAQTERTKKWEQELTRELTKPRMHWLRSLAQNEEKNARLMYFEAPKPDVEKCNLLAKMFDKSGKLLTSEGVVLSFYISKHADGKPSYCAVETSWY